MIQAAFVVVQVSSSMTRLRRTPPADRKLSVGVLSSEGVVPVVPPPWIGVRSRIVSEPEKMVIRFPVVVDRTRSSACAGHGRYSYCHPDRGFNPNWLAVISVEKINCGISVFLSRAPDP